MRIESSANSTLVTWELRRLAEMGIPSLQELLSMLDNLRAQSGQITRSKSSRPGELDRIEPIFGRRIAAFDVDVRRLVVVQTAKEELSGDAAKAEWRKCMRTPTRASDAPRRFTDRGGGDARTRPS